MSDDKHPPDGWLTRGPEALVAGFLLLLSILVIVDSLRVGIGWASDGPRAGYFPFYIGVGLGATSLGLLGAQLLRWRKDRQVFAEREQMVGVWAVSWPMVIYVALIAPLGIYVASVVLIVYFMRRHGSFGWPTSVGISLAVPVALFAVFERWFMVPLPKGPIEQWLGF